MLSRDYACSNIEILRPHQGAGQLKSVSWSFHNLQLLQHTAGSGHRVQGLRTSKELKQGGLRPVEGRGQDHLDLCQERADERKADDSKPKLANVCVPPAVGE